MSDQIDPADYYPNDGSPRRGRKLMHVGIGGWWDRIDTIARLIPLVGKECQAWEVVASGAVLRHGKLARIEITETEVVGVIYQQSRIYRMPGEDITLIVGNTLIVERPAL